MSSTHSNLLYQLVSRQAGLHAPVESRWSGFSWLVRGFFPETAKRLGVSAWGFNPMIPVYNRFDCRLCHQEFDDPQLAMNHRPRTITELLNAWHQGDQDSFQELIVRVYDVLRAISHQALKGEKKTNGLQTTELVHQAFFSLSQKNEIEWKDRNHFFKVAARAMRRVLITEARKVSTEKRGHGLINLVFEDAMGPSNITSPEKLLLLDQTLLRLSTRDPVMAQIVELRYFIGFSIEETANILDISTPTVKRKWRFARPWLFNRMRDG